MTNGGRIWEVVHLFKSLREKDNTFRLPMKENENNYLEAIAWDVIETRSALLRHNSHIFCEMCKTLENDIGWYSFSPIVKDGNNAIQEAMKYLCYEESVDAHFWVLLQLEACEPLF